MESNSPRVDQFKRDFDAARTKANDLLGKAQTENDVRHLVESSRTLPIPEQRALREEAAVKLASPEIIERIEHTLKPYARLLEPNPRGMKLLVNSYSANRALAILAEVEIDLHQLALWTILSSRWPQLADYLAQHPEMLKEGDQPETKGFPEDVKALWDEPSVIEVLKGDSTRAPLSAKTLEQCVRMHS